MSPLTDSVSTAVPRTQPNQEDLTAAFLEHSPFVRRVLRRQGLTDADLADAVQEVFLVLMRRLADKRPDVKTSSFLFGISVRVASNMRRRAYRHRERLGEPPSTASDAPGPAERTESRQQLESLDRALSLLDEKKRTAIILYELKDMTLAEVAEATGAPPATIASRLRAARKHLKRLCRRDFGQGEGWLDVGLSSAGTVLAT